MQLFRARSKLPGRGPPRARGVVVLITLLLVLGVGIGLVTSGVTRTIPLQARIELRATIAMGEAKQALIGRAVADDDRPGSLPCPDAVTNVAGNVPNDGIADEIAGGQCPAYLGRLPWKTLGLPDLRDEHGERLWYALSPKYRDDASAQPINSDTPAVLVPPPGHDRLVHLNTTATVLVPQAVAIIFSAGAPVGAQARDTATAPCATTGTDIPRNQCATNYLEGTGGAAAANNASPAGPYIAAPKHAAFNDRLMTITAEELMPLVEVRVASELRTVLIEYRVESKCQCYPWAGNALGVSTPGLNRGRIPSALALPEDWGDTDVPQLPAWFDANRWGDVIYYTAGQTSLQNKGALCASCTSPTLIVDGAGGYSALFMTPGAAAGVGPRMRWSGYIADVENNDLSNDVYVTPASTAMARNRLSLLPGASPLQCAANAALLLRNAPCEQKKKKGYGKKKKGIKPECSYAADNLQICTCASAAQDMLKKPCSKKIKKSQCKASVTALKLCST
jgi:hypothetical protein